MTGCYPQRTGDQVSDAEKEYADLGTCGIPAWLFGYLAACRVASSCVAYPASFAAVILKKVAFFTENRIRTPLKLLEEDSPP